MQFELLKRRQFITLLGGTAAAWPFAVRSQQLAKMLRVVLLATLTLLGTPLVGEAKNIPRLCFLTFDPGTLRSTRFDAFFQGLRDLGYVDGQTITIDYLSAEGRGERFPALAADCVRLKADIIAVSTTPAAQAAKNTTRTIPIVMLPLGDPVGTGLVDGLAHPGGNVTGMSMMISELAGKRLELLKEAVPGISRVLVVSYLTDPIAPLQVKALKEAARVLGVTLQIREIRSPDDLPAAFDAGTQERAEGLLTTAESIFIVQRARVTDLAARHRLPAMYPYSIQVVDAGGLMAYDISCSERRAEAAGRKLCEAQAPDLQRSAASYVDRNLEGCQTFRSSHPAADEVRADHQSQDCQGARADNLRILPPARRPADRIKLVCCRALVRN